MPNTPSTAFVRLPFALPPVAMTPPAAAAAASIATTTCVRVARIVHTPAKLSLAPERTMFVSTFRDMYDALPDDKLQLPPGQTVSGFLHQAFDTEEKAWKLGRHGVRFYGAYDEGTVVGYLSVDVKHDKSMMYLRQMAVDTRWQRCGVGRRLIGMAVEEAGVERVTVAVRRFNQGAKRFYMKLGFKEGGECESGLNPELYCGMTWETGGDAKS